MQTYGDAVKEKKKESLCNFLSFWVLIFNEIESKLPSNFLILSVKRVL